MGRDDGGGLYYALNYPTDRSADRPKIQTANFGENLEEKKLWDDVLIENYEMFVKLVKRERGERDFLQKKNKIRKKKKKKKKKVLCVDTTASLNWRSRHNRFSGFRSR
eukprot:TRINITY_DN13700_c0_g2_i1.p1 TRINITY_DN13700_c0_g2~~TRINITY_DN13700_c0_g2_i1.p1  ORF type:complete len:108 (-),score=22.99 TRINITY_DN13700_c0_g2_i1:48-371(-)